MMERVYQVQVQFSGGEVPTELMASTAEATAKSFAGGAQVSQCMDYLQWVEKDKERFITVTAYIFLGTCSCVDENGL